MKSFLNAIIYSNLFIALGAASITAVTFLLVGQFPDLEFVTLVFLGSYSGYLLLRLRSVYNYDIKGTSPMLDWLKPRKQAFSILWVVSTLFAGFLFFRQSIEVAGLLILAGLVTIAYGFNFSGISIRLRNVSVLKSFLVALAWAIVTSIIPLYEMELLNSSILLIIERFVFIWAITVPFDIRDQEYDKQKGVTTLPMLLGESRTKQVCIIGLLSAWLMICIFIGWDKGLLFLPTFALSIFLVSKVKSDSKEVLFTGGLDATLIVYLLNTGLIFYILGL